MAQTGAFSKPRERPTRELLSLVTRMGRRMIEP